MKGSRQSHAVPMGRTAIALVYIGVALAGCAARHSILAVTETNIGVDVSQNPANQSPQVKLGYQRVELAIVPTNRSAGEEPGDLAKVGGGAKDYGDVIMELRYGGIFDTGPSSGIYQRLAVGAEAVRQPGASVMFARNADGQLTTEAQQALANVKTIPLSTQTQRDKKQKIIDLYKCHPTEVDAAITKAGAGSFEKVRDGKATDAQLDQILSDPTVSKLDPCK
jgi:hypothetical protein